MSHYAKIKSQYRDKAALVAALIKTGVPQDAIRVCDTPATLLIGGGFIANVIIDHKKVNTYSDIGFLVADKPGMESAVCIDAYNWTETNLKGKTGVHESGAWMNHVRMEYDYQVQFKKATSLGKQIKRIDQGGKIYLAIKA